MIMRRNKKNGFTLVELLAVIVILAIILVIAVPQIMNTIKDTTKASFESSAKMVAAQVENQYTVAQTLSKPFEKEGSCMEDWTGLNNTDYEDCTYEIDEKGNALVTLVGKGKFKDLNVCDGTRNSAIATEEECGEPSTSEACFEFDSSSGTIMHYYLHENNDENGVACPLDVVIPSKINNVIVTRIAGNAFTNCSSNTCANYSEGLSITSVVMPNTITEIGAWAFYGNKITNVKFSANLESIGSGVFRSNQIKELDLSNTKLTVIEGSYGTFEDNNIISIKLPKSIVEISGSPFTNNQISGELDLSYLTNLTSIDGFNENLITMVKLPSSIVEIGTDCFSENPNLTTIINPSGNSFDWGHITRQGTSDTCTFVTGTCGNVSIKAS